MVGVPRHELVQEVAVGCVNLHSGETGVDGVAGGGGEIGNGGADVVEGHLARHDGVLASVGGVDRLRERDRRRRDRHQTAVGGVADPTAVLQLQEHPAALGPHRVGDAPPSGHMRLVVDRGDVGVGLPHGVRRGGLGDDQPCGGALRVVRGHDRLRDAVGAGAVARQRRHHQAVGQAQSAEAGGFEQAAGRH